MSRALTAEVKLDREDSSVSVALTYGAHRAWGYSPACGATNADTEAAAMAIALRDLAETITTTPEIPMHTDTRTDTRTDEQYLTDTLTDIADVLRADLDRLCGLETPETVASEWHAAGFTDAEIVHDWTWAGCFSARAAASLAARGVPAVAAEVRYPHGAGGTEASMGYQVACGDMSPASAERVWRLTDDDIEALRTDAAVSGDLEQVEICDLALDGDGGARLECAQALL